MHRGAINWTPRAPGIAAGGPGAAQWFTIEELLSLIQATGSITEGADTAAGSGTEIIPGSGAPSEGADVSAGVGAVVNAGTGAITEGQDTASGVGTEIIAGFGAAVEAGDTLQGGANLVGTLAAVEGSDTAAGIGGQTVSGAGSALEGADTATGSGTVDTPVGPPVTGSGEIAEQVDVAAGAGNSILQATGSISEAPDTAAGSGSTLINTGTGAIQEGADAVAGSGGQATSGAGAMTEEPDTAIGAGMVGPVISTGAPASRTAVLALHEINVQTGFRWGLNRVLQFNVAVGQFDDWSADWSAILDPGESIQVSAWILPDGVSKGSEAVSGAKTTVWLQFRKSGIMYVQNEIQTSKSRTIPRTLVFRAKGYLS